MSAELRKAVDSLARTAAIVHLWSKELEDNFFDIWPIQPDEVPGVFEPFLSMPTEKSFEPLITEVTSAMALVSNGTGGAGAELLRGFTGANPAMGYVSQVGHDVTRWEGAAQAAFDDIYAGPFEVPVRPNQFLCLAVLRSSLFAEAAIWKEAERSVLDLVQQAEKALYAAIEDDGSDWGFALTVIGAVAGVVSTVLSGGTTAPVVFSVISAAAGVGSAAVGETQQAPGALPGMVVAGMLDGVDTIKRAITAQETKVRDGLDDFLGALEQSAPHLVFQRSSLTERPGVLEVPA
ncbi:hypothetical protein [Nocardioides sp.]|uniref:hypothetical protein n=1 Tax=Nocardioides sp. TaxID=35761 RepID=UPI0027270505|nr:hypothetical protein [Nocardioides sp.]MDO9456110.1 hypothetical protein [Nocardioides sp.]